MVQRQKVVKKRIGELLLERNLITQDKLGDALREQAVTKKLLGEILIELDYVSEEDVIICLTTQYGLPYLPLENYDVNPEVVNLVSVDLVNKFNFVPIDKIGNMITIVSCNILDHNDLNQIEKELGCKVAYFVTTPTALRMTREKYYK